MSIPIVILIGMIIVAGHGLYLHLWPDPERIEQERMAEQEYRLYCARNAWHVKPPLTSVEKSQYIRDRLYKKLRDEEAEERWNNREMY